MNIHAEQANQDAGLAAQCETAASIRYGLERVGRAILVKYSRLPVVFVWGHVAPPMGERHQHGIHEKGSIAVPFSSCRIVTIHGSDDLCLYPADSFLQCRIHAIGSGGRALQGISHVAHSSHKGVSCALDLLYAQPSQCVDRR